MCFYKKNTDGTFRGRWASSSHHITILRITDRPLLLQMFVFCLVCTWMLLKLCEQYYKISSSHTKCHDQRYFCSCLLLFFSQEKGLWETSFGKNVIACINYILKQMRSPFCSTPKSECNCMSYIFLLSLSFFLTYRTSVITFMVWFCAVASQCASSVCLIVQLFSK